METIEDSLGMYSLLFGMRVLLVEISQQEEVFTSMHEVGVLDFEELKLHQLRDSELLDIRRRVGNSE